jgi:hypothetical protein
MKNKRIIASAFLVAACGASDNDQSGLGIEASGRSSTNIDLQTYCPVGTVQQCHGATCTCVKPQTDYVSGTVSGLTGTGLELLEGGTLRGVSTNGSITFAVPQGEGYSIEIYHQPTGQACAVSNGMGFAPGGPFTVTCGQPYTLSGTIEGLEPNTSAPNALTLDVEVNGSPTASQVEISNGHFTLPLVVPSGASYGVTASSLPPGQTCSVFNGSGTIQGANVTTIDVRCVTPSATFTPLANPNPGETEAMWLMQDGTVLAAVAGGATLSRLAPDTSGSYVNGTWSSAGSLLYAPDFFASQVMSNGTLVVCGGETCSYGQECASCQLYDPFATPSSTNPATLVSPPGWTNIGDAPSSILPNGQMLMGNIDGNTNQAAVFDPATMSWSIVRGSSDQEEGYVLLQTGDVLTANVSYQTSMRYSPGSTGFVADGNVPVMLGAPESTGQEIGPGITLADGRVIWFGASGHTAIYTATVAGQSGSWQPGPDLPIVSGLQLIADDSFAVLEPTGRVLLSVSDSTRAAHLVEYDPILNAFAVISPNVTPEAWTNRAPLLLLPNGHALFSAVDSGWYDVQFSGTPVSAPAITAFPSMVTRGTTVTLAGTQLCGLSQVSTMGDDNQQDENYPLVRVSGAGGTTYLRAHDVSTRSIAPNQPGTVSVDVPANLTPGSYSLEVVAMGIGSSPVTVQVQ